MPPVWALSVDLQTRSAVFTSGLAEAAKGARASFQEIKSGAADMGAETGYSMTEARHSVMLLGEEFGVHLPRSLTTFIASLGPIGGALEAAFPFLAILVGATLLLEHLSKLSAEGNKLTESQVNFGTTVANVLNGLDEKLLQAGIRTDELNHDHLGALNKQLEMIDRTSMNELVQAFGVVSKAADATFAELKTSWYQWGAGSAGAKAALESFKTQYDSLLAQGKDREANDLLAGTKQSAEHVLELMNRASGAVKPAAGHAGDESEYMKFEAAKISLKKQGIGISEKEVEAQKILVDALNAQVNVQSKVNELKAAQSSNAKTTTGNEMAGEADKAAREQANVQRAAMEEAEKQWEANYKRAVSDLQANEKEKIEATKQGTNARLAAIDAAIKEEQGKGLQETSFYKSMLQSRVELVRQLTEEEIKLRAEAGRQAAQHELQMGELTLAAEKTDSELRLSAMRNSEAARIADEQKFANEEFQIKQTALQKEIAALDKSARDYENKLQALNNKELELEKQHENQLTQITVKAEEERNSRILSAARKSDDEMARGLTQVLMRHESFAKMMVSLGNQVVSGLMETALKSILADDMTKEHDAAAAARKAYLAGQSIGGPFGTVIGAAMAAVAFTQVMAFEGGGIVPGVGVGDTVPAVLTPGEAVLPKKLTESLSNMAKFGNSGDSGQEMHVHSHHTYHIQAVDGASVRNMLNTHAGEFENHFHKTLRKMNK